MRRLFLFLVLITFLSLGLAWLAERPGEVALNWYGYRIETSLFVAVLALTIFIVIFIFLIQFLRALWHGPEAFRMFVGMRRANKGLDAVARGLVAVGAWDIRQAQRATRTAESYLGTTPLTLLLRSQTAQLSGDHDQARASFEAMLENPQTRLLGLRGLFIEAQYAGDTERASLYAEAASQMKADLPWASQALLITQSREGKWDKVIDTLKQRQRHRLIDREEARRLRAVALTAKARSIVESHREEARRLSYEAHRLDPSLTPAAALSAGLFAETQNFKQAHKIIERSWKSAPHPSLANKFAYLRPGDSSRDRLKRVRQLLRWQPNNPESLIAYATAAAEARDFALARATLKPLLDNNPTQRICLLMAKFVEAEDDDIGAMRSWLDKAMKAPRDAVWMGDGQLLQDWAPLSPVSLELGGVRWRVPQDDPRGIILLQEQMPNIPAPLQNQAQRALPKRRAGDRQEQAKVKSATPSVPFVPDDPGPVSDGEEHESADTQRLH